MTMKDSSPFNSHGQSMIELALLVPLLLVLVLGAVDVAQALSTRQRLENAAYVAALRLRTTPSLPLDAFIQRESGLAGATAGATYSIGGAATDQNRADQVVVTARYAYPLLLPGLAKMLTRGSGTWPLTVSAASVAATDPPQVNVAGPAGSRKIIVAPPSGTTFPSGLRLTCALYDSGTPVPTPQPCGSGSGSATWSPVATGSYTATAMQANGVTSPASTPVTVP
jgi:Flp pilus assembly protein TadG